MKKLSLPPSAVLAANLLLVAVLLYSIFYGAYYFGVAFKKDRAEKEEVNELTKEKLRLEIRLKRIELSKFKIVILDSGIYIPQRQNGN